MRMDVVDVALLLASPTLLMAPSCGQCQREHPLTAQGDYAHCV